jgi:hypothetical protein
MFLKKELGQSLAWNSLLELAVIVLPFGTENLYEPKECLLITQKRGIHRACGWKTLSLNGVKVGFRTHK